MSVLEPLKPMIRKKKLWSGSNSSSICFPRLTSHPLFTGFPWCFIAKHSLCSFSSIDACAGWCSRLPDRGFVLRAWIFSICRTQVLTWKDRNGIASQLWAKTLVLQGFNKKIWVRGMKCYVDKEFGKATINKMIKVGISIKSIPSCFLSTLKCVAVWLQFWSWS